MKLEEQIASLLAAAVRDATREEVARQLAQLRPGSGVVFSTAHDGPRPAGRSRTWLLRIAPKVPGAWREGTHGKNVIWFVPAEALAAFEKSRQQTKRAAIVRALPSVPQTDEAAVDQMLADAGLRLTSRRTA